MSGQRIVKNDSDIALSQEQEANLKKQQSRLNTIVWMNLIKKQAMAVGFSGIIKSGTFKEDNTLSVMYAFYNGNDWKIVGGQQSGISIKSSCSEEKIVWNFPFGVSYQTKDVKQWPQIVLVLYGTDYFGRSMPRGYGNIFLPTAEGKHYRKIRIFKPLQPFSFWGCLNWCASSFLQIKEPQKFLGGNKQRKNLRVEYSGEVQIQIETKLNNFDRHGYR